MVKWTEVDAYSGMPVKEDAPTNFAGAGSKVAMPPDAMMKKKKKKTFLDARTKAYKEHQKRLEAARARREERKKNASKINEEQIDEALSPQDKKVIDAFYFTDKPMTGKILKTDGKTLEKTGMGAQTIAKVIPQSGGEFKVVAKMDGRSTQEIVNYIKKTFPKQLVKYEGTQKTFSQKVMEQIGGFDREIYLAENNIDVIKSVVKSKGAKNLKMKDGKMMVDLFSASAIMNVYNKVNPNNKKKMEKLANGTRADLGKLQRLAMKFA